MGLWEFGCRFFFFGGGGGLGITLNPRGRHTESRKGECDNNGPG